MQSDQQLSDLLSYFTCMLHSFFKIETSRCQPFLVIYPQKTDVCYYCIVVLFFCQDEADIDKDKHVFQ